MARFHVYENKDGGPYLLDVQADLLSSLTTRVVVPMLLVERVLKPLKVLNPVFDVSGDSYVMATQLIASVDRRLLGNEVADLTKDASTVVGALDCLFQGI